MVEFKQKTKTATEILQEVDLKLNLVLGYLKNIDNVQKILLANTNNQTTKQQKPTVAVSEEIKQEEPKISNFERMAKEVGVSLEETRDVVPRRRHDIPSVSNISTVNVRQKIVTNSGGPVFLASVEFIDSSGSLVKQTRTDNNGTWKANLVPGEYKVSIVKRANPSSGKQGFSLQYDIKITGEKSLIDLDPKLVEDI